MHRKSYLHTSTRLWLNSILNIGITPELPFEEIRRTRILNMIAAIALLISATFIAVHFANGRNTLAVLNIAVMAATITMLTANYKRRFYFGQVTVSIVLSIVFTITSFLYHDGMEFYLLFITAVISTIMKRGKLLQVISIADCIIFLLLIKHNSQFYDPTPGSIYFINLLLLVVFFVVFFRYFGRLNQTYLQHIEEKHTQLQHQQGKLTEQTQELEVSNRKLAVLNNTKEKLFSILAHDVRSPISGLKGSLDLLNQNILSREEFMELSKELSLQLNQLQDSLDNLLKWSNRQMTGIEVQKQKILIEPLITDTIGLLQYNLANKNIRIHIHSSGTPVIYADPDHIKLVMRNLISNAIKFSYAGGDIDLFVEEKDAFIHFSVIDKGTGMKAETLANLFSDAPFASQRGTYNEKGTGMGLKISREFAEKNGGEILLKCEPGSGCAFTLTIPAALTSAAIA